MKKNFYTTMFLLSFNLFFSQVGINTPDPKASLDISAKTTDGSQPEGIIAPRLTGDQIKAGDASYGADQKGTLIYAISAVAVPSTKTANITEEGYYFFDGNIWQKVGKNALTTAANGLSLNGSQMELGGSLNRNTSILQGNFPLAFITSATNGFSVNNTTLSIDGANNRVGIGTTTPSVPLEINNGTTVGALKITDGTQGLGKVLTSDPNGVATWSTTVVTAFANAWTPASGTLVNPFTGAAGGPFNTGLSVVIPEKGWYFFRCGISINSECNDYFFYINGIGDVWRSYCGSNTAAFMFPRDQNRVLYFANPGTYTVFAGKTNLIVPTTFNAGNPAFYLDFVKFQN